MYERLHFGERNISVLRVAYVLWAVVVATMVVMMAPTPAAAINNSANTLKVSPVRTDIEVQAGTNKAVQVIVSNLTDSAMVVSPVINDFVSGDERGTPALILDEEQLPSKHSLRQFMSPLPDVTIPPGEAKTVNVVIAVPEGTPAGGYFGAVRFAPSSPGDAGQVKLNASVASLILLKVPGEITESIALTRSNIQQDGKTGSYFTDTDNISFAFGFMNNGDAQIGPFGKISLQKGDEVIHESDFNDKSRRDVILPNSSRQWNTPLDKINGFGQYTVSATFTYGEKNQTIEVTKSFWVVPKSVIIMMIAGLLVVVGAIVGFVLFRRSRRRRRSSRYDRRL